jgi:hypothetical protein
LLNFTEKNAPTIQACRVENANFAGVVRYMPRCENLKPIDPKKVLTRQRAVPEGEGGRCAGVEQIGVTARGTDNVMYVVKENKKGVKS